jgi:thymidylate synthase
MSRHYKNPTSTFEALCCEIHEKGIQVANKSSHTSCLFNVCFYVSDPTEVCILTPERKFNQSYAEREWSWYEKGDRNANDISESASIWKSMVVPGTNGEVNSNYGYFWKLNNQLERMIALLKRDQYTRRAILVHYDPNELDRYEHDTPCNIGLNFYVYAGFLNLSVFARSIDLVYGYCNDQYAFSMLQKKIAAELSLEVGYCHWSITNLHVYERHYKMIDQINTRINTTQQ